MDVRRFAGKLPMLAATTLLGSAAGAQDPGDVAVGASTLAPVSTARATAR